jgi:hypothetical protein
MTRQHPIEPELNSPTPREVGYREGFRAGCGAWAGRLILLPHTLVGLVILGTAVAFTAHYLRVLAFGVECDGQVVRKTWSKGGKGGGQFAIEYTYPLDGVVHAGRLSVGHDVYDQLAEGTPIAIRALPSDPETGAWVRVPGHSAPTEVLGAWGFALFWNGIMCVFLWPAFGRPWRHRRLIRLGEPAAGVVREVTRRSTRPPSWKVTYEYPAVDPDGLGTIPWMSSMVIEKATTLTPGTPVTVLYDPAKPQRSVVYVLTNYRAV